MTGSTRSSHDLDPRRRRVLFRAWRRGLKEMDLILGPFADARVDELGEADLARLEALMDVPDDLLYMWMSGKAEPAPEHDTELFRAILDFHMKGEAAGARA
jgi:antitoxin CptB